MYGAIAVLFRWFWKHIERASRVSYFHLFSPDTWRGMDDRTITQGKFGGSMWERGRDAVLCLRISGGLDTPETDGP